MFDVTSEQNVLIYFDWIFFQISGKDHFTLMSEYQNSEKSQNYDFLEFLLQHQKTKKEKGEFWQNIMSLRSK